MTDSGAFLGGAFAVKLTSPDGALQEGIYRVASRSLGTFKVFLVAGQPGATLVVNRSHR